MNTWYSGLYKAFLYSSMIAFIIGFATDSKTSFAAYISGYSVLVLAISIMLIELFSPLMSNHAATISVYSIFMATGPLMLMLGMIGFILYMLITHKTNIIEGHVSSGYNSFNTVLVMLMACQLYLLYTNISTEQYKTTKKISQVTMSILYLLVLLTGICSSILYVILKYYTTDGFQ